MAVPTPGIREESAAAPSNSSPDPRRPFLNSIIASITVVTVLAFLSAFARPPVVVMGVDST